MKKRPATPEEKEHMGWVKKLPCQACGAPPPSECHHITDGGSRLGHFYTLALCKGCHRGSNGFSGINRQAWDKSLTSQLLLCVATHVMIAAMKQGEGYEQ